ncbi:YqcI/YcgG family protein [Candidatus Woesearchaeota archaeon]|nr:YqcI/YcgG family protein [Candidatus Woesearchaeota archaeon]
MEKCPYNSISAFEKFVNQDAFVCIMGKMAVGNGNYQFKKNGNMTHFQTAAMLCEALYVFIEERGIAQFSNENLSKNNYISFVAEFSNQNFSCEGEAAYSLHTLLYNMHQYDKNKGHRWFEGVSANPKSQDFSYCIGGEAFFIPFFHNQSAYGQRRYNHPLLVFNSHRMFQILRENGTFTKIRNKIRKKGIQEYAEVPKLLSDFGQGLEFPQYLLPKPENLESRVWDSLSRIAGTKPFGELMI